MGFLAPLYALGALAVLGPILFHLIRRQPQGQVKFSSLMFLAPSPPRLTRKSRLDNILLMMMRILAILLIAFAFARPYMREESLLASSSSGRNVVLLLDTSASMQRADVWQKALDACSEMLAELTDQDLISLYTIDEKVTPVVPLSSQKSAFADVSKQSVRSALQDLRPSWLSTDIAAGLKFVADTLNSDAINTELPQSVSREIVLISDLAAGSEIQALQGYPWPPSIQLQVRQIHPTESGNATLRLVTDTEDLDPEEQSLSVRIENNQSSGNQTLQIAWASSDGIIADTKSTVQVPPNQSRLIPLTQQPPSARKLQLLGDAWDGDNEVYIPELEPTIQQIGLVRSGGREASAEDVDSVAANDMMYFLKQAPLSTSAFRREFVDFDAAQLQRGIPSEVSALFVDLSEGSLVDAKAARRFAEAGGTIVVCLSNPPTDSSMLEAYIRDLSLVDSVSLAEGRVDDFALVAQVDYTNAVFAPFADPKFNDFSKIRIWAYRRLKIDSSSENKPKPIAFLDDGSPLLFEQRIGRGKLWILTTGWQTSQSSLALSSKFVPLLAGLLSPLNASGQSRKFYSVGEPIDVDARNTDIEITSPIGTISTEDFSITENSVTFHRPGLFALKAPQLNQQVAIQVPPSESNLDELDPSVLEQYGIVLGKTVALPQKQELERQRQVAELEGKQRLWQWLIAAGLVVLLIETLWAGTLARRRGASARQLANA